MKPVLLISGFAGLIAFSVGWTLHEDYHLSVGLSTACGIGSVAVAAGALIGKAWLEDREELRAHNHLAMQIVADLRGDGWWCRLKTNTHGRIIGVHISRDPGTQKSLFIDTRFTGEATTLKVTARRQTNGAS